MATEKIYPLVKKMDEEEKVDPGVLQALFDNGVSSDNLVSCMGSVASALSTQFANHPNCQLAYWQQLSAHLQQPGCCSLFLNIDIYCLTKITETKKLNFNTHLNY